jgi:predicted nucleic acid-binding protein
MDRPLRVMLDINVWLANLIAFDKGHKGTASQELVSRVSHGIWGSHPTESQLVISFEMMDTLERVLKRRGYSEEQVRAYVDPVPNFMRYGPEEIDPYLLLVGRDQLAIHDREDAGVLATAIAARVDLLVTDNLDDFLTNDTTRLDTRWSKSENRQLFAAYLQAPDTELVVAHPFDVMEWLRKDIDFEPRELWQSITSSYGHGM